MAENVDSVATKITELLSTLSDDDVLELAKRLRVPVEVDDQPGSDRFARLVSTYFAMSEISTGGSLPAYRLPGFTERLKEAFRLAKLQALSES
jgi:hypothetical protein